MFLVNPLRSDSAGHVVDIDGVDILALKRERHEAASIFVEPLDLDRLHGAPWPSIKRFHSGSAAGSDLKKLRLISPFAGFLDIAPVTERAGCGRRGSSTLSGSVHPGPAHRMRLFN